MDCTTCMCALSNARARRFLFVVRLSRPPRRAQPRLDWPRRRKSLISAAIHDFMFQTRLTRFRRRTHTRTHKLYESLIDTRRYVHAPTFTSLPASLLNFARTGQLLAGEPAAAGANRWAIVAPSLRSGLTRRPPLIRPPPLLLAAAPPTPAGHPSASAANTLTKREPLARAVVG